MTDIFSVCNGIVATATSSVGSVVGTSEVSEVITAIEDMSVLTSIPLQSVTLPGILFITVLSFTMILAMYRCFFKLHIYVALSAIALVPFAGKNSTHFGKVFLRSYIGVCMEGVVIVLAYIIFSSFVSSVTPAFAPDVSGASQMWSYFGEVVFNMLVLVGLVKSHRKGNAQTMNSRKMLRIEAISSCAFLAYMLLY